jgi:hypothetical protein
MREVGGSFLFIGDVGITPIALRGMRMDEFAIGLALSGLR